jgi:hypothetical protein
VFILRVILLIYRSVVIKAFEVSAIKHRYSVILFFGVIPDIINKDIEVSRCTTRLYLDAVDACPVEVLNLITMIY